MKKIVFTTPILEYPAAGGPQLRILNSLKALNGVSELHCVSRVSASAVGDAEALEFVKRQCRFFTFAPSAAPRKTPTFFERVKKRLFKAVPDDPLSQDAAFIAAYAENIQADIIWFGYGNISFPLIQKLRELMPEAKFVCDTDSVWSRFILRELETTADPARRKTIEAEGRAKEEEEKQSVRLCDVTPAVSAVDADYYRSISPRPDSVHVFSNVIDMNNYDHIPEAPADFKRPALFLGGSYYDAFSPMVHAAEWVAREVMPIVRQRFPEAHLYLVGRGGDVFCQNLISDKVTATGKVPSVLPYLGHAVCSLVPLFFESGTRFKILESGACSVAVVSTTLGAEGIPVINGKHCLIADTPDDFAKAVMALLENDSMGRELAANCKALVRENYSIEVLAKEARAIMNYLSAK